MNESEIGDQIREAYPQPAWVTLFQVRDGTGFATRGQSADAFAFGTWPSRGFRIIGFEIKSYRGDWLRELKNPAKAEPLAKYADEWWLVTNPDVAKLEEIPANWGWAVATDRGLKKNKTAVQLTPVPIERVFLMSIIRNVASAYVPHLELERLAEKKTEEALKNRRDSVADELERTREELNRLQKELSDFEAISGIKVCERWGHGGSEVGAIVKAILGSSLKHHIENVNRAAEKCQEVLATVAALPFLKPPTNGHGDN